MKVFLAIGFLLLFTLVECRPSLLQDDDEASSSSRTSLDILNEKVELIASDIISHAEDYAKETVKIVDNFKDKLKGNTENQSYVVLQTIRFLDLVSISTAKLVENIMSRNTLQIFASYTAGTQIKSKPSLLGTQIPGITIPNILNPQVSDTKILDIKGIIPENKDSQASVTDSQISKVLVLGDEQETVPQIPLADKKIPEVAVQVDKVTKVPPQEDKDLQVSNQKDKVLHIPGQVILQEHHVPEVTPHITDVSEVSVQETQDFEISAKEDKVPEDIVTETPTTESQVLEVTIQENPQIKASKTPVQEKKSPQDKAENDIVQEAILQEESLPKTQVPEAEVTQPSVQEGQVIEDSSKEITAVEDSPKKVLKVLIHDVIPTVLTQETKVPDVSIQKVKRSQTVTEKVPTPLPEADPHKVTTQETIEHEIPEVTTLSVIEVELPEVPIQETQVLKVVSQDDDVLDVSTKVYDVVEVSVSAEVPVEVTVQANNAVKPLAPVIIVPDVIQEIQGQEASVQKPEVSEVVNENDDVLYITTKTYDVVEVSVSTDVVDVSTQASSGVEPQIIVPEISDDVIQETRALEVLVPEQKVSTQIDEGWELAVPDTQVSEFPIQKTKASKVASHEKSLVFPVTLDKVPEVPIPEASFTETRVTINLDSNPKYQIVHKNLPENILEKKAPESSVLDSMKTPNHFSQTPEFQISGVRPSDNDSSERNPPDDMASDFGLPDILGL